MFYLSECLGGVAVEDKPDRFINVRDMCCNSYSKAKKPKQRIVYIEVGSKRLSFSSL